MSQPPTWALAVSDAIRYFNLRPWQPRLSLAGKAEPLPQRIKRLHAAWEKSRLSDGERAAKFNTAIFEAAFHRSRKRVPSEAVIGALLELGSELVLQNDNVFDFPTIDLSRSLTAAEAEHVTDTLIEIQTRIEHDERIHDLFSEGLCALFTGLLDELPPAAVEEGAAPFSVPLYALLDPVDIVGRLVGTFLNELVPETPDAIAALPFMRTRLRLWQNILDISHLTPEQLERTPHKLVGPKDCGLPPPEMVAAYLGGTPLAPFVQTAVPFAIPRKTFAEHGAIFAPTGHGKTQLLQTLIHCFLQEDDPPGMFILDSQGDEKGIIRKIEKLDVFHPDYGRLRDRLVILDPEDPQPPALNFFDFGKYKGGYDAQLNELFQYLFTAIDSELTAKQGTAVTYLLRLMAQIPNATIETLKDVMEENARSYDKSRYWKYVQTLDKTTQDFFRGQFYSGQMKDTRPQVTRRLYTLLADPLFMRMFSAPENRFNAAEAMRERKIVLINTSQRELGETSSAVFGRFFVAQIFAAALERGTQDDRHLSLLFIDEAHEYLDKKTEKLLDQARKFGLGLIVATQRLEKIDTDVKSAINSNTAIKMAGPVSYADAQALAREIYCDGEFIRSMGKEDNRYAEFAAYVRNVTPRAIKVTMPFGTLERAPKMDVAAHARVRETNRKRVGAQAPAQPVSDVSRADPVRRVEADSDTPSPAFGIKPGKEW